MNGLSINNLFPTSKVEHSNQPISVSSLYGASEHTPKLDQLSNSRQIANNFDLNKLLTAKQNKQDKAVSHYKKRFNMILNRIGSAHSFQKSSIICDVPDRVFRCVGYTAQGCIEFIENRLRRLYMDTLQLNDKSIFISWANIDENKQYAEDDRDNTSKDSRDNGYNF